MDVEIERHSLDGTPTAHFGDIEASPLNYRCLNVISIKTSGLGTNV